MLSILGSAFLLVITSDAAHFSHNRKAHSYFDLRVKLSPIDKTVICTGDPPCSIPYAISVLHSSNHLDLQSVMIQDGGLLMQHHDRYSDSTVIRLTKAMKPHGGKLYLGLRFLDLPVNYVIMDVTMITQKGMKKKMEMITEDYRLNVHVTKEVETHHGLSSYHTDNNTMNATTCQCIPKNCACCMMLNIGKIALNGFGCVNITYIPEDIGIRLSFSINGYTYISRELSLRNPPPYCLSMPFLKEYAAICLRLRNIKIHKTSLTGCLELDAELYHIHVATVHFGCFNIPI
uniref:DUF4773 domain-containing protein n=1 Tax=Setaria digitata TaxID=48799 RepID=A0A915Q4Q6_9BILA